MMTKTAVSLLLFLTGMAPLPCAAADGGMLSVQRTAPFEEGLTVPEGAKKCLLETSIPGYIRSFALAAFDDVVLVDQVKETAGPALRVTIKDVSGAGGGAWSGPRYLIISGTLWKDGAVAGTFVARRTSGGVLSSCRLLDRCAMALGKDVAKWLRDPTMNARLGEFYKK